MQVCSLTLCNVGPITVAAFQVTVTMLNSFSFMTAKILFLIKN